MRNHIPYLMMEQVMIQRNRSINLRSGRSRQALTITHPNAAGIDIGSASHFVAVPPERDDQPVREFPSFALVSISLRLASRTAAAIRL